MFIYKLFTIIGFALLVLLGVIAAIFLYFYMYKIVDANAGIFDAFKKSAQTAKAFPELVFPYVIISYVGTYGIPYFILAPFFGLGSAYMYRKTLK